MDLNLLTSAYGQSFDPDTVISIAKNKKPGFLLTIDLKSFSDACVVIKECPHVMFRFNSLGWSGTMHFEEAISECAKLLEN